MPTTPFIGVRISWLMLARNCDFARLASSAWRASSRASRVVASSWLVRSSTFCSSPRWYSSHLAPVGPQSLDHARGTSAPGRRSRRRRRPRSRRRARRGPRPAWPRRACRSARRSAGRSRLARSTPSQVTSRAARTASRRKRVQLAPGLLLAQAELNHAGRQRGPLPGPSRRPTAARRPARRATDRHGHVHHPLARRARWTIRTGSVTRRRAGQAVEKGGSSYPGSSASA